MFKEWRAADRLIAERNPNYWDKDKPYLDRVIVRPLPDSDARYASLVKGDVQVIWEDRAENILKAKKDKNLDHAELGRQRRAGHPAQHRHASR